MFLKSLPSLLLACVCPCITSLLEAQETNVFTNVQFKISPAVQAERSRVSVPATETAPEIDGILDDDFWNRNAWQHNLVNQAAQDPLNPAKVFLGCDDEFLYIAYQCRTSAPPIALVGEEVRDGNVWGDDCVDFKITSNDGKTVYQFLFNSVGAIYDSRDGDTAWNSGCHWGTASSPGGFTVEIALEKAELGISNNAFLFTAGRRDRSVEALDAIYTPYGSFKYSPLFLCGAPGPEESRDVFNYTRTVKLDFFLDRQEYPSFQPYATGRICLDKGNGEALKADGCVRLLLLRSGKLLSEKKYSPVTAAKMDFDLGLQNLEAGNYVIQAAAFDGEELLYEKRREFTIESAEISNSGVVPLKVHPTASAVSAWPLSVGVPFPAGALFSSDKVQLRDSAGNEIPIQKEVIARWSKKGSIQWLRLHFIAPLQTSESSYFLHYGKESAKVSVSDGVMVKETDESVVLANGFVQLLFSKNPTVGMFEVRVDHAGNGQFSAEDNWFSPNGMAGPYMVDQNDVRYYGSLDNERVLTVEDQGPIHACVSMSGWHIAETGERLGRYILRFRVYRGLPQVQVSYTFIVTACSNEQILSDSRDSKVVQYRDIGLQVPFAANRVLFGTPQITVAEPGKDGAYLLQADDRNFQAYADGKLLQDGGKAEGWMSALEHGRGLALAVRDFWQQYPKELEVTDNSLIMHAWPAHGREAIYTGEKLNIRNAYRNWFVHEGRLLDFKVPEEVLELVKVDSEKYNYPHAKLTNAMGLAKTHELLLIFHENNWRAANIAEQCRIFQETPAVSCDPEWVCNTRVFGRIHPKDTEKFPVIEQAISETVRQIARSQKLDADYGMFNFGDSHHNWNFPERRWSLHRIWHNTHHGWNRWPWLLYARSADKRILDYARRNMRHVADIDHCHYSEPEFERLGYPLGKEVGGMCDYKGFVHWASGARFGYNSAADALLWHYYVTGAQRSLTTALEHGQGLLRHAPPHTGRSGAGRMTSAAALFQHTWDNDYLEFVERHVDLLLASQEESGRIPGWANFAPFLQNYINLTGSARARKALLRWADYNAELQLIPRGSFDWFDANILAHAWFEAGDERYLNAAAYRLYAFADHIFSSDDTRYDGVSISFPGTLKQSYFLQTAPFYMKAAAASGRKIIPAAPKQSMLWVVRPQPGTSRDFIFKAYLRKINQETLPLKLFMRGYGRGPYVARLVAEDGAELWHETVEPVKGDNERWVAQLEFQLPEGVEQDCELTVQADKTFFIRVPLSDESVLKEVYALVSERYGLMDGYPYYFNFPPEKEKLVLQCQLLSPLSKVEFRNPTGTIIAAEFIKDAANLDSRRPVVVPRGAADTWPWSVSFRGDAGGLIEVGADSTLEPPKFAVSPDKWFDPAAEE